MTNTMNSILDAIGNIPLVRLDRLVAHHGLTGTILAKLDYLNPGFSKKDRAALGVIEAAERDGSLKKGQCVVELTSGNMGTGLATGVRITKPWGRNSGSNPAARLTGLSIFRDRVAPLWG